MRYLHMLGGMFIIRGCYSNVPVYIKGNYDVAGPICGGEHENKHPAAQRPLSVRTTPCKVHSGRKACGHPYAV